MLNYNKIKEIIKKKPAVSIAGIAIFGLVLWGVISLLTGGDAASSIPTYEVKKGPLKISITEDGTIQPMESIVVKNEVEGQSTIIYLVDEGTKVKKGELMIELDSSTLGDSKVDQEIQVQSSEAAYISAREAYAVAENQAKSDISEAELAYEFAQMDLKKYLEGEYINEIREAESNIKLAEEELALAGDTLEWSKKLYEEGYLSQSELEKDELSHKQKELAVELKQAAKKLLEDYTYKRKVAELESDVEQAKAALERTTRKANASVIEAEANYKAKEAQYERQQSKLKKIENQLAKTKIYAPADGTVIYATSAEMSRSRYGSRNEPMELGSTVRERQELIHLPTDEGFNVEISVPESSLDKVKVGLPVKITLDTLPGEVFTGRVTEVSSVVNAQSAFMNPDLKVYDTVIAVDNTENADLLRSGMSCKAEIIIEQYEEAIYVPVQAVLTVDGKPTVYTVKGDNLTKRVVETGLDNSTVIRIASGLEPGDIVSLSPPLAEAAVVEQTFEKLTDISSIPEADIQASGTSEGRDQNQGSTGGDMSGTVDQVSRQGQGGSFISRFDMDNDGKISQSEFQGPENFFSQIDKNGDGYISSDEEPQGRPSGGQVDSQGSDQRGSRGENLESGNSYSTTGSISDSGSSESGPGGEGPMGGGGMPGGESMGGGGGGPGGF